MHFDSIHSPTDVNQLTAERVEYAKSQKVENENLMQDLIETEFAEGKIDSYYTEIMGNSDSKEEDCIDFYRIEVCDMVELQDLPCRIVEVDMQDFPTIIMDELRVVEINRNTRSPIRLAGGQVLEEFMLEEETDFQGIDKCKIAELPDRQEIERCASPEMSMRITCDQEECIEEEICNMSLPKSYEVEKSVHKDEVQQETHKINVVEISTLPREMQSEMPLEKGESKLVQDVDTSVHAELSLPNETIDLCKISPFEVSVASRKILGKIPKLHTKWKRILGSKLVKRAKPTRLVNNQRKIHQYVGPLLNHRIDKMG